MSTARANALALVAGIAGTILWHWPLIASGLDQIPGDVGDARATIYLTEHWYQVFRGNAEALSPAMFHPVKGTMGYAETMFIHALPYTALRVAGMDMFGAIAVPVMLFTFLNYATCYVLLRRVLGIGAAGSVVGALFFAFNSPRFNHSGHYGYQASFFVPVAAAFVAAFVQRRAKISQRSAFALLAGAAVSLALQFVISPYQGWFVVFWACLFLVFLLALRSTRHVIVEIVRRFPLAIAGSAIVLVAGLYPLWLIYAPVQQSVSIRSYFDAYQLTPDVWSLLQMGDWNYVWGRFSVSALRIHPQYSRELYIGIGLVPSAVLLALIIWAARTVVQGDGPDAPRLVLAASMLASATIYLLAMRYWNGWSPWHLVYRFVPGASGLRAIARHVMILALPIAVGFAVLIDRAMRRISLEPAASARRMLTAALFAIAGFGILEQFGRATSFSGKAQMARLKSLAASLPADCSVFYAAAAPGRAPVKHEDQIDAMLISVMTGVPTVNGYSGHVPRGWALREVEAPDYEQRVARWIRQHDVSGRVCRLAIGD
jgi:hypothetical protein